MAYLGAANAGIPLSIIVKDYGWGAYFTGAGVCLFVYLLLFCFPHCFPLADGTGWRGRRGGSVVPVQGAVAQAPAAPTPQRHSLGSLLSPRLPARPRVPALPAALLAACGAAVLLLAPMIGAKSYIQLENERKAAAAKLA